jgi:hypothetical protein
MFSDGLPQVWQAGGRAIVSLTLPQSPIGRLDDKIGGQKIRFPDLQVDDVSALGLQQTGSRQDLKGRLRPKSTHPFGDAHRPYS